MVGFLCTVLAWILVYFDGNIGANIASWKIVTFSILIFTYNTLDNIDGKQARRTKTSTPLGMLFDHGCDSLSCFLVGACLVRILGIEDEKLILFGLFLGVQLTFFMSVWTQYHSQGIMMLGKY
jgi:ethanolaminephosphotransferase